MYLYLYLRINLTSGVIRVGSQFMTALNFKNKIVILEFLQLRMAKDLLLFTREPQTQSEQRPVSPVICEQKSEVVGRWDFRTQIKAQSEIKVVPSISNI